MNACQVPKRIRVARRIGFALWIALIVFEAVWHGVLAPARGARLTALAVAVVPLLLPWLAIRRPQRALVLAGLVALLYFCHGVADLWTVPTTRVLAALEIVLSLGLIFAIGATVPKRKR